MSIRAMLAAALGHLGQVEEARQVRADLMEINPDFVMRDRIQRLPFANPADAAPVFDGLAKAGLAE